MDTDKDIFHRWRSSAKSNVSYNDESDKDYALVKNGVTVWYHKTEFKTKIKLIVNPSRVLGHDDLTKLWKPKPKKIIEFIVRLDAHLDNYFNAEYGIEDFKLTRIDFTKNVRLDDGKKVAAYIKVLHNIRKVKGFSPKDWKDYDGYDENASFDLEGNSNGVQFVAYDKAAAIKNNVVDSEYKRKEMKERLDKAKGILRLEVKLTTQKAIRRYTNESDTVKRIIDLCNNSTEIFLDTFIRVVPFGDFHKKDKVVKIIEESVSNKHLKRKMLHLLELIPKKKSLYLAQKALAGRNIEKIMKMFAELNVSPVTLSKRHDVKHLSNLYAFI